MRPRCHVATALLIGASLLMSGAFRPALAGVLYHSASCTGPQQITVTLDWQEETGNPVSFPQWVGYDLLRSPVNQCGPAERINAQILPRVAGQSHVVQYVDTPPNTNETYRYSPLYVDANRDYLYPGCEAPCTPSAWASCPTASSPLTVGLVEDWGWTLFVHGCPGSCYSSFYIEGPASNTIRDQGLVGSVVQFHGSTLCCSVEGASLVPTSWQVSTCGSTAVRRASWGGLKTIYR